MWCYSVQSTPRHFFFQLRGNSLMNKLWKRLFLSLCWFWSQCHKWKRKLDKVTSVGTLSCLAGRERRLTSSSCAVKCGPVVLLRAMMTATMSLPLRMGAARTLRVVNSVSSSTNGLKYWFCKEHTGPRSQTLLSQWHVHHYFSLCLLRRKEEPLGKTGRTPDHQTKCSVSVAAVMKHQSLLEGQHLKIECVIFGDF